jgi:hypothetical protein
MLITDNSGYKVFCEVDKIHVGENNNHVRVYTTFDGSRDPEYKQIKFEAFLTDSELEQFRRSLNTN